MTEKNTTMGRLLAFATKKKAALTVPVTPHAVPQPPPLTQELAGRFANLFMICYRRRDMSGMHVTLTAFTHSLHALKVWPDKLAIMQQTKNYILMESFPVAALKPLEWLLNHYFEQPNDGDESQLLLWYQSIDDEWVLRKKLREMFPDKPNSVLTALIAAEQE